MVDRQQRQAARPQRLRDIRSPLCRVGWTAVKKRAPIRIPHLLALPKLPEPGIVWRHRQVGTSEQQTQCEGRPNRLWFGRADVRRCGGWLGGSGEGSKEGFYPHLRTISNLRTVRPPPRLKRRNGAVVDRLVPSCYRRRVNSRATACYCCACPCEPGDAGPMGERRE